MYNQKTKLHAILKEKINPDCLIKPSSPLPPCLHTSISGFLRINSEWTWTDLTHSISQTFPLDDSHICELGPNKAKRKNAGCSTGWANLEEVRLSKCAIPKPLLHCKCTATDYKHTFLPLPVKLGLTTASEISFSPAHAGIAVINLPLKLVSIAF